jgi:hypothetical protein
MEVSGQLITPSILPPGKKLVSTGYTPEPVWTMWRREKSLPYRDSILVRPVRSPSTYRLTENLKSIKFFTMSLKSVLHCNIMTCMRTDFGGGGKFNYVIMCVKTLFNESTYKNKHTYIVRTKQQISQPSHCVQTDIVKFPYSAKRNAFQNYTPHKNNPGFENNSQLSTIYLQQGWGNVGPRF